MHIYNYKSKIHPNTKLTIVREVKLPEDPNVTEMIIYKFLGEDILNVKRTEDFLKLYEFDMAISSPKCVYTSKRGINFEKVGEADYTDVTGFKIKDVVIYRGENGKRLYVTGKEHWEKRFTKLPSEEDVIKLNEVKAAMEQLIKDYKDLIK